MAELLIGVSALALAAAVLCYAVQSAREDAMKVRCRNNLIQLAKGLATYVEP